VEITFIRIITTYKRNIERKLQKNNIPYVNSVTSSGLLMWTHW